MQAKKKNPLYTPHPHTHSSGYTTMYNQGQTQQALFPLTLSCLSHTHTHFQIQTSVMLWPFVLVNHPVSCFPRLPAVAWPLATSLHGQESLMCHFLSHFGPAPFVLWTWMIPQTLQIFQKKIWLTICAMGEKSHWLKCELFSYCNITDLAKLQKYSIFCKCPFFERGSHSNSNIPITALTGSCEGMFQKVKVDYFQ